MTSRNVSCVELLDRETGKGYMVIDRRWGFSLGSCVVLILVTAFSDSLSFPNRSVMFSVCSTTTQRLRPSGPHQGPTERAAPGAS